MEGQEKEEDVVLVARNSACARNCIHTILCYPKKPETRGSPLSFHSRVNRRDLCSHKSRWHEALVALPLPSAKLPDEIKEQEGR